MSSTVEFGTADQLRLNRLLGGRFFTPSSPTRLVGFTSRGAEVRPGVMAYDSDFLAARAAQLGKTSQLDALLATLGPATFQTAPDVGPAQGVASSDATPALLVGAALVGLLLWRNA